jgi:hypothetical protein
MRSPGIRVMALSLPSPAGQMARDMGEHGPPSVITRVVTMVITLVGHYRRQ